MQQENVTITYHKQTYGTERKYRITLTVRVYKDDTLKQARYQLFHPLEDIF